MKRGAILGVAVLLLLPAAAGCGGDDDERIPAPSSRESARLLEVPAGGPVTLAPGTYTAQNFTPPAGFQVGEGWSAAVADSRMIVLFRESAVADCLCVVNPDGVYDPATGEKAPLPADLTAWLQEHPGLDTSKASSLQVGDRAARQMEAQVAKQGGAVETLPIFAAGDQTYSMAPGEKGHIIVIEHPEGPLVLGIRAPAAEFADYFRAVETVAGSLTFEDRAGANPQRRAISAFMIE
jgi:hypothetical protein